MKRTVRNSLLALLVGVAAAKGAVVNGAAAQDVQGRNWAGACTGCHGTEGRSEEKLLAKLEPLVKRMLVELLGRLYPNA